MLIHDVLITTVTTNTSKDVFHLRPSILVDRDSYLDSKTAILENRPTVGNHKFLNLDLSGVSLQPVYKHVAPPGLKAHMDSLLLVIPFSASLCPLCLCGVFLMFHAS